MLIRAMLPEDCEALAALRQDPALGIDPAHELAGHLTRAWVACASTSTASAPLGYALGWWVVDELQLLGLGVLPTARRSGVARRLLAHVLDTSRASGGRRVLLEVARGNAAAVALYEGAGFRVFNVRPRYYPASGDDALEMEFTLGDGETWAEDGRR
jgi:ribosomal-protein-alanine N-acetyltransferase